MPEPPEIPPSLRDVPIRDPRVTVDVFPGHGLRASRQGTDPSSSTYPYPEIRRKARLVKRFFEAAAFGQLDGAGAFAPTSSHA